MLVNNSGLSQQQSHMLRVLNRLRDQSHHLRLEQTAKLDELSERLKAVLKRIQSIPFEEFDGQRGELPGVKKGTAARIHVANTLYPKDLRTLEGILSDLNLTEKDLTVAAREQVLLESLNFASRPYRHENIPVAHASTFEWIFPDHGSHMVQNNQESLEERSRFVTWLKSGSGTFWVFGKAGAGKSTLMKFIASHHKTRIALKEWAGPKKVVMATHYFWSTGTAMQKSLRGLLQELLFNILCCCPELAPDIFPDRWRRTKPTASLSDQYWSADELHEGLRLLARHHSMPVKCCFFIDGLDEFDGDHYNLCQLLKELSSSANLKCCVSSRPWNVFEDAFASDLSTKLCIHDLTIQDIWNYTESSLQGFPRWKETCISDKRSIEFISDITQRAQGVFLWVFLVTRSLRDGLVNGDTIHDLQRRLKALPTDLELFFKHMLDLVDPFYHQYMSRTFQMTINAKEPFQLLTYYARESEDQDDNYVLEWPLDPDLALANPPSRLLEPCRRRINARCGGLLGFKKDRVEFLHRTVHDFLLTRPMQDYLEQKAGPGYKVNLSTVKSFAFQFRCFLPAASTLENITKMKDLWNKCLRYANEALDEDEESGMNILDTAPDICQDYAVTDSLSLRNAIDEAYQDSVVAANHFLRNTGQGRHQENTTAIAAPSQNPIGPRLRHTFLASGVDRYVTTKLGRNPYYFHGNKGSPLFMAIDMSLSGKQGPNNLIPALLDQGLDPNEKNQSGVTPWHFLLAKYLNGSKECRLNCGNEGPRNSIFSMFLRSGAHKTCRQTHDNDSLFPVTHFILDALNNWDGNIKNIINIFDDFFAGSHEQSKLQLDEVLSKLMLFFHTRPGWRNSESVRMTSLVEKIMSKGNELETDMEFMVPSITKYFAEFRSASLVAMIRHNKNQLSKSSPACAPAKRSRDSQSEDSSQDKKRKKLEGSSHCKEIQVEGKQSVVVERL